MKFLCVAFLLVLLVVVGACGDANQTSQSTSPQSNAASPKSFASDAQGTKAPAANATRRNESGDQSKAFDTAASDTSSLVIPQAASVLDLQVKTIDSQRLAVIFAHRDGCPHCNIFHDEVLSQPEIHAWLAEHAIMYQSHSLADVEELMAIYGTENVDVPGLIFLDRSGQKLGALTRLRETVTRDILLAELKRAREMR